MRRALLSQRLSGQAAPGQYSRRLWGDQWKSSQNDPLGCSVAKEVIAVLREENLVERGNAIGTYFLEGLRRLEAKYNIVKEARGRGMLLALEFRPRRQLARESKWEDNG
ncbi:MAG: aminotransferase class III-fold pyridoxal phosphate-dependent enzyme [Candidatus Eisenbacteria bacterium]|nr:aminotransferase class III-fold pyridoxal phosphate-dependent enzyme [Candidatus Eisenbacteria bacterium]